MVYIIKESERGFLFKDGVFEKMLTPGKYRFWDSSAFEKGRSEVRRVQLTDQLTKVFTPAELAACKRDAEFAAQTVSQEVPDGCIAIHRVDGLLAEVLPAGKYLFWNITEKHDFELYDMTEPDVPEEIPAMLCDKLRAKGFMKSFEVGESQ
ncbi:MAG: slipin family protein, partial [Oscillospiraceae bacterium]|nr:slipin family protein [Oscillospiraceae bacterium]